MAKKKVAASKDGAARVLVAVFGYAPNDVVVFPEGLRESLKAQGAIDDHPDAVAYCVDELGSAVQAHKASADVE